MLTDDLIRDFGEVVKRIPGWPAVTELDNAEMKLAVINVASESGRNVVLPPDASVAAPRRVGESPDPLARPAHLSGVVR